jgi:hypothetical protein
MNTKMAKLLGLVMFMALAQSSITLAQDEKSSKPATEKSGKTGGDKKKTNIDFEDELVEGELKKPELFYLLQKKQFNFKRLIKLREDFLPEMRRDGDEIKRSRSKN